MSVRPVQPGDISHVAAWAEEHGIEFNRGHLPRLGLVAISPDGQTRLAAGWMLECEGGLYLFDLLISNPGSDKRERDAGLDEVVAGLLAAADSQGRRVFAWTQSPAVVKRARKHGFGPAETWRALAREPFGGPPQRSRDPAGATLSRSRGRSA